MNKLNRILVLIPVVFITTACGSSDSGGGTGTPGSTGGTSGSGGSRLTCCERCGLGSWWSRRGLGRRTSAKDEDNNGEPQENHQHRRDAGT